MRPPAAVHQFPRLTPPAPAMDLYGEVALRCPYCGEPITLLVDWSAGAQHYVEDCEVCCRPIELDLLPDADGAGRVGARRGDE